MEINASTRYVFFSDCHRGIGGDNDNFLPNAGSYLAALQYYYPRGLTYIEVGDGEELWENFLWKLSRFLVRYFWTPLEAIGVRNPTSASQSSVRKKKLESHTHRAVLGNHQSPYYNCGCCVHPNCITCIELQGFEIGLVRWCNGNRQREVLVSEHLL